jgi:hypothetical protein
MIIKGDSNRCVHKHVRQMVMWEEKGTVYKSKNHSAEHTSRLYLILIMQGVKLNHNFLVSQEIRIDG